MKFNVDFSIKFFLLIILLIATYTNSASFGLLKKGMKNLKHKDNPPTVTLSESQSSSTQVTTESNSNYSETDLFSEKIEENTKKINEYLATPIHFQGWVKYLHYNRFNTNNPKNFYKNTQFDIQNRSPANGLAGNDSVLLINQKINNISLKNKSS